jgi:hypothetical protein
LHFSRRHFSSSRHYERLAEGCRTSRRTVADAVAVLQDYAGFSENDRAEIRIGGLRLPSAEVVGLVQIVFDRPDCDKSYLVSLPTSRLFRGRRLGTRQYDRFNIELLDDAVLDGGSNVRLTDGTLMCAVEVFPARLPLAPTALDWLIVYRTIRFVDAKENGFDPKERCFRLLRNAINDLPIDMIPNLFWIDCSRLTRLAIPSLDSIATYIASVEPTLRGVSQQKIADTLEKFGMRIPRPRAKLATRTP